MTTPAQKQVLDNIGRSGWDVTSSTAATDLVEGPADPATGKPTRVSKYPPGSQVWVISDGKGHNQTMVVKPPTPVGTSVPWPTDASGNPTVPDDAAGQTTFQVVDPPSDLPANATPTPARPPEPNVSTSAAKIPVWNDTTKQYDWIDNPNYTPGSTTRPPEPSVSTSAPQIPKWDTATNSWTWAPNPNYKPPEPKGPDVRVVGNQLIDVATGKPIYTAPEGVKFETAQDGTILAIDPANPGNPQVVWKPTKPPSMVPGQSVTQPNLLFTDPVTGQLTTQPNPIAGQGQPTAVTGQTGPTILQQMPDGSYRTVPNPAYQSKFQQSLADYQSAIGTIESQLASGALTIEQANQYKTALKSNLDAALQGTTPYQQWQDQQRRATERMQSGQSLLNQRVASGSGMAESLLNSAIGIVGNKNFMDPSAVAGFTPFAGARDYVTELGGGQGVYDAAAQAVKAGMSADDPASALLQSALNPAGGQPNPNIGGGGPQGVNTDPNFTNGPVQGANLDPGFSQAPLLAPGQAGTVDPNDPRYVGTAAAPGTMPGATDPGLALLQAALGGRYRQPQQTQPTGPLLRGALMG